MTVLTSASPDRRPFCLAMRQSIQRLLSSPLRAPSTAAPIDTSCGVACCNCSILTPAPFADDRCLCTHLWAHHMPPSTDVITPTDPSPLHFSPGEDDMGNLSSNAAKSQNGEGVHVAFPPSLLSSARQLLEEMGPRAILLCLGKRPLITHDMSRRIRGLLPLKVCQGVCKASYMLRRNGAISMPVYCLVLPPMIF